MVVAVIRVMVWSGGGRGSIIAIGLVFGLGVYGILVPFLLEPSFIVLVGELALPFTFIGIFFLDAQDHFLPNHRVEGYGSISRDGVPVLDLPCVDRTSAFAYC